MKIETRYQPKPSPQPLESHKAEIEWGRKQSESLWTGLYSKYVSSVDGKSILDLGCSWGYLLKFLLDNFRPKRLFGLDMSELWVTVSHGWNYEPYSDVLSFHAGQLSECEAIPESSLDYVFCTSVMQYLRPEQLLLTLEKAYDLLCPGGELILRTRCYTSYIGADMHSHYRQEYPHLLFPLRRLQEKVEAETKKQCRYLNYLTASNYLMFFTEAGFETLDVKRRYNSRSPELMQRIQNQFPWISPEELNCAELEARLVKPIGPDDLGALLPT